MLHVRAHLVAHVEHLSQHETTPTILTITGDGKPRTRKDTTPVKPNPDLQPLGPGLEAFFQQRGISRATLDAAGVMQERRYVKELGGFDDVIAFVYKRRGQTVNVKYRTKTKRFSQVTTSLLPPVVLRGKQSSALCTPCSFWTIKHERRRMSIDLS